MRTGGPLSFKKRMGSFGFFLHFWENLVFNLREKRAKNPKNGLTLSLVGMPGTQKNGKATTRGLVGMGQRQGERGAGPNMRG